MSTSFSIHSNVYTSAPPLEQRDSFNIHSNVFTSAPLIEQGDSYSLHSNIGYSTSSNEVTFYFILTEIHDIIPDPAPMPGGVKIIGTLLNKVTAVLMDDKKTSFRILSDTEIYAVIPTTLSDLSVEVKLEYRN